ncbi:MAG: HNH endonuclease [Treponema sp.]|nr:HNH endonuclease [Treponema sp.]
MKRKARTSTKNQKTYIDGSGYRKFKDSGKSVHRWAAEKKLGRKLKNGEIVHHKNRDKLDNSPSNLRVLPNQKEHYKLHKKAGY